MLPKIGLVSMVVVTRATSIAPDPRVERVALCLARHGVRVLMVGWDREGTHAREEKGVDGTCIYRVRAPGSYGGGLANLYGLAVYNIALLRLLLRLRPAIVHAVDLDTAIPAVLARCFIGTRLVYDIADWYAQSRKVGLLAPLVERVERWVVRHADYVLLAHEGRVSQIGGPPEKWTAIYNTPERIVPPACTAMTGPYFAYVGVLHEDRGIRDLIESASLSGAGLVLAGFGPLERECALLAEKKPSIRFLGRVSYEQALSIENGSVAILALYDPRVANNRWAAPNKLYEAMMLGKPIITSADTLAAETVEREKIGIVVQFGDQREIVAAMQYLLKHHDKVMSMGARARALYDRRYSYEAQCSKLLNVYDSILPGLVTTAARTSAGRARMC